MDRDTMYELYICDPQKNTKCGASTGKCSSQTIGCKSTSKHKTSIEGIFIEIGGVPQTGEDQPTIETGSGCEQGYRE